MVTMALKSFNKMFSAAAVSKFVLRGATAKEMDIVTRRAVREGWSIGPYDFRKRAPYREQLHDLHFFAIV